MIVSTLIELREINESIRQILVEAECSNTQLIKDLLKELSKIKEKLGCMNFFSQCITENANRLISVTKLFKVLKNEPFYLIPFEYKYCMWVYINGNGIGLNRHISISLLSWNLNMIIYWNGR